MRVGIDATPLLGRRTGVGTYVAGLLDGLAALADPPEVVRTAFTWRQNPYGRRFPARLLQQLWLRGSWPPGELLTGPVDVFHGTNYVLPPLRRAAGVLSVHDLTYLRHADTVTAATLRYRTLVPRACARGAHVLTLTSTVAGEVASEYGLPGSRVHVARPGVSPAWFSASAPSADWLATRGLPREYLVFVGTAEPRKNLPVLLAALSPDLPPLVVAGPPGWGPAVEASPRVVVPGYLSGADLRAVVAGAAALVLPSRYEGFGLPPLEALACGTPAVVSDLPVFREVLGPYASYASPGDPDALRAAIHTALDAGRGTGRAHAAEFTWTRCASEALAAYEQALADRH